MQSQFFKISFLCLVSLLGVASAAQATLFNLEYSGVAYGNSAVGVGQIDLDLGLLPNPGATTNFAVVNSLTLTIAGASVGNGTFTKSDFSGWVWNSGVLGGSQYYVDLGAPELYNDLTQQWLSAETGSDFNFTMDNPGGSAPQGVFNFLLRTQGGTGDYLRLVSFSPVPEPSSCALLVAGGIVLAAMRKRAGTRL